MNENSHETSAQSAHERLALELRQKRALFWRVAFGLTFLPLLIAALFVIFGARDTDALKGKVEEESERIEVQLEKRLKLVIEESVSKTVSLQLDQQLTDRVKTEVLRALRERPPAIAPDLQNELDELRRRVDALTESPSVPLPTADVEALQSISRRLDGVEAAVSSLGAPSGTRIVRQHDPELDKIPALVGDLESGITDLEDSLRAEIQKTVNALDRSAYQFVSLTEEARPKSIPALKLAASAEEFEFVEGSVVSKLRIVKGDGSNPESTSVFNKRVKLGAAYPFSLDDCDYTLTLDLLKKRRLRKDLLGLGISRSCLPRPEPSE